MRSIPLLLCAVLFGCTASQTASNRFPDISPTAPVTGVDTSEAIEATPRLTAAPAAAASGEPKSDETKPKRVNIGTPGMDWVVAPPDLQAKSTCSFLILNVKTHAGICASRDKGSVKAILKTYFDFGAKNKDVVQKPAQYSSDGRLGWFDTEFKKGGKVVRKGRIAVYALVGDPDFPVILLGNWDPEDEKQMRDDFTQIVLNLQLDPGK